MIVYKFLSLVPLDPRVCFLQEVDQVEQVGPTVGLSLALLA